MNGLDSCSRSSEGLDCACECMMAGSEENKSKAAALGVLTEEEELLMKGLPLEVGEETFD